ncbi:hypothetical protein ANCDUO_25468, partial [Ancylostoma duodenale]
MLAQRLLFLRLPRNVVRCRYNQVGRPPAQPQLVPLSSLKRDQLGHSILFCKETMPPGSPKTPHDSVARIVFVTKVLSLSSSIAGVIMVPVLSSYLWEAAAERPTMMMFTI